jgi:hypothetical protein
LAVLVAALEPGQVGCLSCFGADFSVKEKDEASLPRVSARWDLMNAFILRFAGV